MCKARKKELRKPGRLNNRLETAMHSYKTEHKMDPSTYKQHSHPITYTEEEEKKLALRASEKLLIQKTKGYNKHVHTENIQ